MGSPPGSGPQAGPNAPAGWYQDPDGFGQQRYWDGSQWTDRYTTSAAQQSQTVEREGKSKGLLILGVILAVVIPIGGVVVGIILLARRELPRGLAVVIASVAVGLVYAALFGAFDSGGGGDTDAATLEDDLPNAVADNEHGTFRDVQCVSRGENVYRCLGEYKPSMEFLREEYGDYGVSERDLRKVQRQQTGQTTLEVTVDDDGSYIYEFLN